MKNNIENLITERKTLWHYLKECKKPIVLYGMGNGAEKIMSVLESYGMKADEVFASDEFVRGHSFCGYKVKKLSEIESEYDDFIILLSFGAGYTELINKIKAIANKHELYAPDLPVYGDVIFTYEYFNEHIKEAQKIYDMLADEKSRQVFCDVLNYKISGKIDYLFSCESERRDAVKEIINPKYEDIYVDLGAYNGDTVLEMLELTGGKMKKIIAFEPDKRNYRKLSENTAGYDFCECINDGAWSEDTSITFSQTSGRNASVSDKGKITEMRSVDSVTNCRADIIKMDVEGAEEQALLGAEKTICSCKPRLIVSAYHRSEDIFKLPLFIQKLNPEYKLFLRHHPYIPAWETEIYAK